MTVRSWLATCSSTSCTSTATDVTIPLPKNTLQKHSGAIDSETVSTSSTTTTSYSSSTETSSSSLESNLSLQTLPSVPSLQKSSSPEALNIFVSHKHVTSFKPQTQTRHISCLAISKELLYAASGSEINVYDLTNNSHVDHFNGNDSSSGSVKAITFYNEKVYTAHQDCKIRVWQIMVTKQHQLVSVLPTLKDRLRRSVMPKNYVRVRRHKKRLWIEHADTISDIAVRNGFIYSVSWDKCMKIWHTKDHVCLESIKVHEDAVNAVAVSTDGTIYTGSADRLIRVWSKSFGEKQHGVIATLEKHKSAVNALVLNADGTILFSGACDRSILVWEREDSAHHMVVTGALRGHTRAILCLVNVSDLLMSGSADRTVRIWQRGVDSRYCCLAVLDGHERAVKSLVAVSESASSSSTVTVCSGSLDGAIKVWQVVVSNIT